MSRKRRNTNTQTANVNSTTAANDNVETQESTMSEQFKTAERPANTNSQAPKEAAKADNLFIVGLYAMLFVFGMIIGFMMDLFKAVSKKWKQHVGVAIVGGILSAAYAIYQYGWITTVALTFAANGAIYAATASIAVVGLISIAKIVTDLYQGSKLQTLVNGLVADVKMFLHVKQPVAEAA